MQGITEEMNEKIAYRLIRIKARNGVENATDIELANYVRGVVDMQTVIYEALMSESREDN